MPKHILVVEDDWEIARLVAATLHKHAFNASLAKDWDEVLAHCETSIPDLIILDIMLPGVDGLTILRRLRERFEIPVIMLTAKGSLDDRVKGLTYGADDYIIKPFHSSELVARIRAVLKRAPKTEAETEQGSLFRFEGWTMDTKKREITDPDGVAVMFTGGEFDVLEVLCRHWGETMGRDRLAELSQNRMVEPYDRSIDTLVSRIRRKFQDHAIEARFIKTVRNKGYVFTPTVQESRQ